MTSHNALPPPVEAYAACRTHLDNYPIVFEQPVAWGEMDAFGHVNNIVYFRYFESARMAYFQELGYDDEMRSGLGPILAETRCRFRVALRFPDYIAVGATVTEVEEDRFHMAYAVASYRVGGIAAEGTGLVVSYDYNRKTKAPLPTRITDQIHQIQSRIP